MGIDKKNGVIVSENENNDMWYKQASKSQEGQIGWTTEIFDSARYGIEPYTIAVAITPTKNRITVSATLTSTYQGLVLFQKFWKYELKEKEQAKKTFGEVKKIVGKVFDEFKFDNEIPNSELSGVIRYDLFGLDDDHVPKSTINWVNWAQKERGERSVRSQIYGKRYPANENGF